MQMRVLDLFSGIGGFSLGLEAAGMETVAFCEIDPFCRQILKKRWPDVPIFEDIFKLNKAELVKAGVMSDAKPIDVICGGFPCQPFSVAGKQRSKDDDRYLWPEMLRVITEVRPRWVIGENVPGIIKLALDDVLSDLENIGYTCQPFTIPACAVNAPQKRDRAWIVGYAKHDGSSANEERGST